MSKTIAIMESRMPLDKRLNMVQELTRRDYALLKYISSHTSQNNNSRDNQFDNIGLASKSYVSPNTPRADEANL